MICKGNGVKVAFPSKAMADEVGSGKKLKSYRCPKCRMWHLTRGKRKKRWWNQQKALGTAIRQWNIWLSTQAEQTQETEENNGQEEPRNN
jgi:hypothetical protein